MPSSYGRYSPRTSALGDRSGVPARRDAARAATATTWHRRRCGRGQMPMAMPFPPGAGSAANCARLIAPRKVKPPALPLRSRLQADHAGINTLRTDTGGIMAVAARRGHPAARRSWGRLSLAARVAVILTLGAAGAGAWATHSIVRDQERRLL